MKKRLSMLLSALLIVGLTFGVAYDTASATVPGVNQLISQDSSGNYANGPSDTENAHVSGNGRFVLFDSTATNLISSDTNGHRDVFVRDTQAGTTTLASVTTLGGQFGVDAYARAISNDGRFVLFALGTTNMLDVRDMKTNTTLNVDNTGGAFYHAGGMSADGRYVTFSTSTYILSGFSPNDREQVYVKDMVTSALKPISADASGNAGNDNSTAGGISCDGGTLAFTSYASNLGGVGGLSALYIANLGLTGVHLQKAAGSAYYPSVSCDGNQVSYGTVSSSKYIYHEYNRLTAIDNIVSLDASGATVGTAGYLGAISGDGRYVAFMSNITDPNHTSTGAGTAMDVYVRDTKDSTTQLVTFTVSGNRSGQAPYNPDTSNVSISSDGSYVTYTYLTPDSSNSGQALISGVTTGTSNTQQDVYESQTGF